MSKLTAEERLKRQQERDAKRRAAREKLEKDRTAKETKLTPEVIELIEKEAARIVKDAYKRESNKLAQEKFDQFRAQLPDAIGGTRVHDKVYCRFSCEQLLAIFGGWFTLNYAFSTKYQNTDGTESETDFYVCSQDVSGLRKNERPPLNKPLYKAFGIEAYGFAIIAPSTAFA